jgi:hypothetical protein
MYKHLEEVLGRDRTKGVGSSVDWDAIVRVIMNRYGKRLEMLQYILQRQSTSVLTGGQGTNWTEIAIQAHDYLTAILSSYIMVEAVPSTGDDESPDSTFPWAKPVFKECATSHTVLIENIFSPRLTHSEGLILDSVKVTDREICRVLVRTWAEGVLIKSHRFDAEEADLGSMKETVKKWEREVTGLMDWLGWDIWMTCRPACGPEAC